MARTRALLPPGTRLTDFVAVGVLAKAVPLASVTAALQKWKRTSVRQRDLPAHVVVYYVLAMGLYMNCACREVLRCLLEGLQWLRGPLAGCPVAGDSGISQARQRVGWEPIQQLHDELVRPVAQPETRGAWYRQWRLVMLVAPSEGAKVAAPGGAAAPRTDGGGGPAEQDDQPDWQ